MARKSDGTTRDLWGTDEQNLTSGHTLCTALGSEWAKLLTMIFQRKHLRETVLGSPLQCTHMLLFHKLEIDLGKSHLGKLKGF